MTPLEQFESLRLRMPRIAFNAVQNENSPFCQYTEKSKKCYMTFASYQSEDCMYNHRVFYCTDCNDCTLCHKSELLYECVDCINSYNCNYSVYCENAIDSSFCYYCVGIQDCFGCVGLHQKKFHIFNKKYSQEEYRIEVAKLKKLQPDEIYRMMEPIVLSTPRQAMYGKHNEDSYGENIHYCKNTFWAFDSKKLWDCAYCYHCDESKNLYDCSHHGWAEECYQVMNAGNLQNCMFCLGCWFSNNLTYCDQVFTSHDCFICVG
ncbi:MAG: hypothetical protein AAB592_00615, partial [Patescibacteria group bacterium]